VKHIKIYTFIIIILVVAAACSSETKTHVDQASTETITFEQGNLISSSFVNASLPSMKGVAQNDSLQLLIDEESAGIAVINKKTGTAWFSNPPNRDLDLLASGINKDMLSAQLKLDYYNAYGQLSSINTYTDSVSYKQTSIEPIENGVAITYKFGTEVRSSADLPLRLSKARFEELSSQLDKAGQRALLIAYKEDKVNGYYDRNDGALQGLQLERALAAFDEIGYTPEDLIRDAQEHNLVQEKEEARVFFATIEYSLEHNALVARVPVEKIIFPEDYPINVISVLPFFGAGDIEAEGSMLVPDGSGALIHFNNGKQKYASYQQAVYGDDMTIERTENVSDEQKVRLPVFGMIHNQEGWVGVIEGGAPVAAINADISGRLNSYNSVYASFTVVNKGDVTLSANEQKRTLPKFQEAPMKSDFVIRFIFVDANNITYNDLAKTYQQYLLEKGMLVNPKQAAAVTPTFYLDIVGNIEKQKHFLGIPYQSQVALTTFDEADIIVNKLLEHKINAITMRYSGWFNGGVDHSIPNKIKVDSVIGGQSRMNSFINTALDKGVTVYPDIALAVAHSDNGFKPRKDAARSLRETPALFYPIDLALDRRDRSKLPSYVIAPKYIEGLTASTIRFFNKQNIENISLRDLADLVNSDYLKHNQIDRTESLSITIAALQNMSEAKLNLLADGGNAYAFPFSKHIVNAPMSSSGFKITDESIPFYQLVISGYIDYTGAPYNLSNYINKNEYVLKLLENGSGVHFKWIFANNSSVKETEHNDLYALNYEIWLNDAKAIYDELNQFYSRLSSKKLEKHEKLQVGVYKTTYEDGHYVVVNYNQNRVNVEGQMIEALGYTTGVMGHD